MKRKQIRSKIILVLELNGTGFLDFWGLCGHKICLQIYTNLADKIKEKI